MNKNAWLIAIIAALVVAAAGAFWCLGDDQPVENHDDLMIIVSPVVPVVAVAPVGERIAFVRGKVIDRDSKPVPQYSLFVSHDPELAEPPLIDPEEVEWFWDDHFEMDLPVESGELYLYAKSPGGAFAPWGRSQPFTVVAGADIDIGTIRVQFGAIVKGRVVDDEGRGIAGVEVSLFQHRPPPPPIVEAVLRFQRITEGSEFTEGAAGTIMTDTAGAWQFEHVWVGDYVVTATHEGYADSERAIRVVGLFNNTMPDVPMTRGGTLRGTTLDATRRRVPNVTFKVINDDDDRFGRMWYSGRSDAAGEYAIENISPGKYYIRVDEWGGQKTSEFGRRISGNDRSELVISEGETLVFDIH